MPPKTNPLKLNKLQLRTLALAQVLANDPNAGVRDEASGEVTLMSLPRPHGDHVHIGAFVVSARDASGFANPAVWTALARKGLTRTSSMGVTLTVDGLNYETGLSDRFVAPSDHLRLITCVVTQDTAPEIYVDGDACPVKEEVLRVATRHGLKVHLVGNSWLRHGGDNPLINRVVVPEGPDAADDWIAEHIGAGDIAVTDDIPLAARCLERGAHALGATGSAFTPDNIGNALAMRDLKSHLRETGEGGNYNPSFTKQDRSHFLQALENTVQALRKRA